MWASCVSLFLVLSITSSTRGATTTDFPTTLDTIGPDTTLPITTQKTSVVNDPLEVNSEIPGTTTRRETQPLPETTMPTTTMGPSNHSEIVNCNTAEHREECLIFNGQFSCPRSEEDCICFEKEIKCDQNCDCHDCMDEILTCTDGFIGPDEWESWNFNCEYYLSEDECQNKRNPNPTNPTPTVTSSTKNSKTKSAEKKHYEQLERKPISYNFICTAPTQNTHIKI